MIVIAALLIGAAYGAWRAKKLGGKAADMAQYAAGFGLAFAIAGLILTLVIERLAT